MLKVIKSTPKSKPDYAAIYWRVFIDKVGHYDDSPEDRKTLKQIVYAGVKHVITSPEEDAEADFHICCLVEEFIAELTPRELLSVFPIEKVYDGHKYQCKDYFYTVEALQKAGLDKPISENIDDLLWDYMNDVLKDFTLKKFSAANKLIKKRDGKGIVEQWADENNITSYSPFTDKSTGNEYMRNNTTGEFQRVRRKIPRYLKLVNKNK